jgi:hypothetical protein
MKTTEFFEVPGDIYIVDTPTTWTLMQLLGVNCSHNGVAFSKDQERFLGAFYGFDLVVDEQVAIETLETVQIKYEKETVEFETQHKLYTQDRQTYQKQYGVMAPKKPVKPNQVSSLLLLKAGSRRNLFRYVERDGLRLMAFLAQYLEPNQDPVKLLAQLCIDAGFDVSEDYDWIFDD